MKKISLIAFAIATSHLSFCQISYQSEVRRSNPYVPPVDLNLMQDVLTKKENAYDNNLNYISERFRSIKKLLNYVPDLNKTVMFNEYNKIANTAKANDLSDRNVINFLSDKLDFLETVIDYTIINPKTKLGSDIFN